MLIDSHCHLNMIDLTEFDNNLDNVVNLATDTGIMHMLSVSVEPKDIDELKDIANKYSNVSISVGVHPSTELDEELSVDDLVAHATDAKCIAIGETGLDYYRTTSEEIKKIQQTRFRRHIQASKILGKPLIIHTREAQEDTLRILEEERAFEIGGVMHCFTENYEFAKRALDLNFYISFSGIVTFKNALTIQDVALKIPLDKILIETDSPYLAPTPYRGKQNNPSLVKYVAEYLASLRGIEFTEIANITTNNFYKCFKI